MSKYFKPQIPKPQQPKEVELKQVQGRGATGRTILGGAAARKKEPTNKKSILGG